jgi:hypothetical protein
MKRSAFGVECNFIGTASQPNCRPKGLLHPRLIVVHEGGLVEFV